MNQNSGNPFFRTFLLLCLVCLGLMLLSFPGYAESDAASSSDLYAGFLTEADRWIDIPALRQYGDYTCGATCVQMLMNWLSPYDADLNLTQYEELLGTTPETGTSPSAVLSFLEESDVEFAASQALTLSGLQEMLAAGHPVMMPLQAWSSAEDGSYNLDDPSQSETYLAEGHWVLCVGYGENADGLYFLFNDPACVGHTMVYADELDSRWIDMDGEGTVYDHFGIEILQKTEYDGSGLFYMD
ncbi:MAG: C39 family peptidase [Candidatus Limiplasma sp.]|nr:C39 family peptidase [Candidatus Limiplasma sp.]